MYTVGEIGNGKAIILSEVIHHRVQLVKALYTGGSDDLTVRSTLSNGTLRVGALGC